MRVIGRCRDYVKVLGSSKRHRADLYKWLGHRPQVLAATGGFETALLFSNALDPKLKELAELKAAGLVSCEFCLDIGSALAQRTGVTERQIRELPKYQNSDAYTDLEKLVLAFAQAMTETPAVGEDLAHLRQRLAGELTDTQIVELAVTVAWENQRARLNQSLGVRPTGMSDGAACALPEKPAAN